MENVRKGRIAVFTRKYLTKLLLAAVILTAGFSLRFVALAKYTSYLYDFTGAVASDFCFTSNYLDETGDKLYRISKWDGSTYTLDLELRNFENALRYNKANVNTAYYLDVEVKYKEGEEWETDESANVEITGKTNGSDCVEGEYGTNGTAKKTCFLLNGMDDGVPGFKFERKLGTHNIRVTIKDFSHKNVNNQIIVTAKTIPASEKDKIVTSGELTSYTGDGVYDITLSGTFQLEKDEIKPVITQSCTRPDEKSRAMLYTLTCTSLGSGTPTVRIYYNPEFIEPDSTMVQKSKHGIQDGAGNYKDYKYVTIQIQSNSITRCWLFSDLEYVAENAIIEKEGGLADVFFVVEDKTQADGPGGGTSDAGA